MKMMQNLRSSLLRREIKLVIPSGLRLGAPACVLTAGILMLLLSARSTAFGGSATWRLDPGGPFCNSCWDILAPENWTPATVPNGPADIATFDVSNVTHIFVDQGLYIEVDGIVFNAGASAFTIDVGAFDEDPFALNISGVGITNNSGITQNFNICGGFFFCGEDSAVRFTNDATAGDLTVFTVDGQIHPFSDNGTISFEGNSTADKASVKVLHGGILNISGHNPPGVTVGSIEGDGLVFLGS
jgi:hypothetical protein